jgi:hypothetical protein
MALKIFVFVVSYARGFWNQKGMKSTQFKKQFKVIKQKGYEE